MYKAVRGFVRYSRYPETRPHRWRVLGVGTARWIAAVANVPMLSVALALMVLTWPFWWLHERISNREFWLPTDPILDWHAREVRRLNPIYFRASKPQEPAHDD